MTGQPPRVIQIKADLEAAKTVAEVLEVADRHRAEVKALAAHPDTKVFAIHISNLKAYRIWCIKRDAEQESGDGNPV